jgi:hypothetical protein
VVVGTSTIRNASSAFYSAVMTIQSWDVTDRTKPVLGHTWQLEGSYLAGRMIDGRIYLVAQTWPSWLAADGSPWPGGDTPKYIRSASPLFRELHPSVAGTHLRSHVPFRPVEASADRIGHLVGLGEVSSWVSVLAIDVDTTRPSFGSWKASVHAGRGSTVMVSRQNIYVAATTASLPPYPTRKQMSLCRALASGLWL